MISARHAALVDEPNWTAVFTIVIAAATVTYVWFTRRLWIATKAAAEAAKDSADAARQSAEIAAALHRPYIGVLSFKFVGHRNKLLWWVACAIKNFGTLPAHRVAFRARVVLAGATQPDYSPPCAATLQPGQEEIFKFAVPIERDDLTLDFNGTKEVWVRTWVEYVTPETNRYRYNAQIRYHPSTSDFLLAESHVEGPM